MAGYPSNLPDSTPDSTPAPDPTLAPQSTYDTLKNRGTDQMAQADRMSTGKAPIQYKAQNPDNNLPQDDGIFHRVARMFK
jgi:hypothetical protein